MSQRAPQKRREPDETDGEDDESKSSVLNGEADPFSVPAGKRWTLSTFILVHEARLMDEGETLANPALPMNGDVKRRAKQKLNRHGIAVPAVWKDVNQYPNLDEGGLLDE